MPAGDVAIKNVADLYLYPNTARAVRVTGGTGQRLAGTQRRHVQQIDTGRGGSGPAESRFPSYNFDVMDGVTYQIDLSQPSKFDPEGEPLDDPDTNRIVNLTFKGNPLTLIREFIIATNNYRASGGGSSPEPWGIPSFSKGPTPTATSSSATSSRKGRSASKAPTPTGASKPLMPGASVLFDTGPKAADYADEVPGRDDIAPAGEGPDGFARFRIEL